MVAADITYSICKATTVHDVANSIYKATTVQVVAYSIYKATTFDADRYNIYEATTVDADIYKMYSYDECCTSFTNEYAPRALRADTTARPIRHYDVPYIRTTTR
eukprot:6436-Heterococcus_DN1.PRE.11